MAAFPCKSDAGMTLTGFKRASTHGRTLPVAADDRRPRFRRLCEIHDWPFLYAMDSAANRLPCAASKRLERKHLPSPTRAYGDNPWRFRRPACATRWLATAAAHAASQRAGNSAPFRRIPRPPYIGAMLRDHGRRRSGRGSSLPDSCRAGWS